MKNGPLKVRSACDYARDVVIAIQAVRQMKGESRSLLMEDTEHKLWVVKFQNNPQHRRVLVNDYLGSRIAQSIGLTVPSVETIFVAGWLEDQYRRSTTACDEEPLRRAVGGLQFASKYMGGLMPGQVVDSFPGSRMPRLRNGHEFAGIALFDLWLKNKDVRQMVFSRSARERVYKVAFIDQGHCFGGWQWQLGNVSPHELFIARGSTPVPVKQSDYEPWLAKMERFSESTLHDIAEEIPSEWYEADQCSLARLLSDVMARRQQVCQLFAQSRA